MAAPREHPAYHHHHAQRPPPALNYPYSDGALPTRTPAFYQPAPPLNFPQPHVPSPNQPPQARGPQRNIPPSLRPGYRSDPLRASSSRHYDQPNQHITFPEPQLAPQLRHSVSTPFTSTQPPSYNPPVAPPPPRTVYHSPSPHPALPPKPCPSGQSPRRVSGSRPRTRSDESLKPALPPKPALPSKPPPSPREAEEDETLKRVLELSARESETQRQRTLQQEEADLAKAMQESLQLEQSHLQLPPLCPIHGTGHAFVASPVEDSFSPCAELSPAGHGSQHADIHQPSRPRLSAHDTQRHREHRSTSHGPADAQTIDDDELVRRLSEEDGFADDESANSAEDTAAPLAFSPMSASHPSISPFFPSAPPTSFKSGEALVGPMVRSISANAVLPSQTDQSNVSGEICSDQHSTQKMVHEADDGYGTMEGSEPPSSPTQSCEVQKPWDDQYLDTDLLRGVEIGRGVPTITSSLEPLASPMPNAIPIPYGSQPPFYIRASSWRGLLKLMASLRRTRLEPPVQALAQVETELKLRIVVAFVKVHSTSSQWLTILFMTIDHPVPASMQWKYRSGDTTTLPYSYTLSSPMAILRDGADAPMSRFYTIPSTYTPFPQLPIIFPSLASYLASALDDSRNASHDSSNGARRLAKMVDAFYPLDSAKSEADGRIGVRERLRHFVGMGNKPSRDRNAETYELVTPFVADEFGR